MLLTVVYGVYTVFFEGKSKPKEITAFSATEQLEGLSAFINKVAEASKAGLSKEDEYIIQQAEAEWKQDPRILMFPGSSLTPFVTPRGTAFSTISTTCAKLRPAAKNMFQRSVQEQREKLPGEKWRSLAGERHVSG